MLDTHPLMVYNAYMTNEDPNSTVECGVCQDSTPWSRISSELLNGELVCHSCMSMELARDEQYTRHLVELREWVFQDPYKNDK